MIVLVRYIIYFILLSIAVRLQTEDTFRETNFITLSGEMEFRSFNLNIINQKS